VVWWRTIDHPGDQIRWAARQCQGGYESQPGAESKLLGWRNSEQLIIDKRNKDLS